MFVCTMIIFICIVMIIISIKFIISFTTSFICC